MLLKKFLENPQNVTGTLELRSLGREGIEDLKMLGVALRDSPVDSLDLMFNGIGRWSEDRIRALFKGLRGIKTVDLRYNDLGNLNEMEIEALFDYEEDEENERELVRRARLTYLGVTIEDEVDEEDEEDFQIISLDLGFNSIGAYNSEGTIRALTQGLARRRVIRLGLSGNDINWSRLEFQLFMAQIPHITSLDFSGNWNGWHGGLAAIAEYLPNTQIETLNLSHNRLDRWNEDEIIPLIRALQESPHINWLNLESNFIRRWNPAVLTAFVEWVQQANNITLNLSPKDINHFYQIMRNLPHLCDEDEVQRLVQIRNNAYLNIWDLLTIYQRNITTQFFNKVLPGVLPEDITRKIGSYLVKQECEPLNKVSGLMLVVLQNLAGRLFQGPQITDQALAVQNVEGRLPSSLTPSGRLSSLTPSGRLSSLTPSGRLFEGPQTSISNEEKGGSEDEDSDRDGTSPINFGIFEEFEEKGGSEHDEESECESEDDQRQVGNKENHTRQFGT